MNLILLSGGGGKRLWPISNNVRSKQFIKVFRNDKGEYESMIQRVYRQIMTAVPSARITIATSECQADIIREQLGEEAAICSEPCRRDTFPAIVLAAAYLRDCMGADPRESVVVCPVDSYVEPSFFETVGRLDLLVQQNEANLILMGITPTEPSEKYGYIIPETLAEVSRVKAFKEKPSPKAAKSYLEQNALWNAGVFAFRLEYLLKKAREVIPFESYGELYENYEELPRISFDYGFVEQESSIQVVRYNGCWKDVGTWNMMAEVVSEDAKGRVILDDTCRNTQVVNDLNIPIICMGCKDMIIAVSEDGILISDKERSGYIKPYVEKVTEECK